MGSFVRDLRHGARRLVRTPRFTALAVLTLALGLGATTAVFTVVESILLRPLPYARPDRLVVALQGASGSGPVSPADFFDYQREAHSFEGLGVAQAWGVTLGGGDRAERLDALTVSGNLFGLLGVSPALGRAFLPEEDQPGGNQVVLLSDRLWRRRFGADPRVIGQAISLNGEPYVVVGVMPPGFRFAPFWATRAELWAPIALARRASDRDGQSLRVFGRLKDGVTVAQAQAEMSAICARLARAYPATNASLRITVTPLLDKVVAGVRPTLAALLALVACVLLIACANVANAWLARAAGRQQEVALRIALGARRGQIVRQLLTESVLAALVGAAAGLVFARWGVHAIVAALPAGSLPRQQDVGFDAPIFMTASLAALAAGIATGLAPALHLFRDGLAAVMRDGGRGVTDGAARRRLREGLIAVEVALALALLVGAGVLGRTMLRLNAVDPGFRVDHLAVATVSLDGTPYTAPDARRAAFARVREGLAAVPGVTAVGAINHLPLAGDVWTLGYSIDGRAASPAGQAPHAVYRVVQPGYFPAMALPLVRGRAIDETDTATTRPVAVINQAMADRQWPGQNPVGATIRVPGPGNVAAPIAIVGVSANARQGDWTSAPDDEVYLAFAQRAPEFGLGTMTFVVRTSGDAGALATSLPRLVARVDRSLAVSGNATMAGVVGDELWRERLTSELVGAFACVALGLAAIGVYAVVAFAVAQRTREIGVRVALGATRGSVQWMALAAVLRPVCWGVAGGVLAAIACARSIRTLVAGADAADPLVIAGGVFALIAVAALAGWLPARRASRLDPVAALRQP